MDQLKRIAVLADDEMTPRPAKTLTGILRYRSERVIAVIDRANAGRDTGEVVGLGHGIPVIADVAAALAFEPDAILLATEPTGGALHPYYRDQVIAAAKAGVDVINGLHAQLADDAGIAAAARAGGATLWDVRREPAERYATEFGPDGKPLFEVKEHPSGSKTVLAIGTDCGIGKMTTMLEIEREALARGLSPAFVATGQIGMMISGAGVALDAVMGDFINPVIEGEVCARLRMSDLVLVEGQGAINHPRFSSVTLGLLHGTRPDALILCHDLRRPAIKLLPGWALPSVPRAIEINHQAADWIWPDGHCRVVGLSVITAGVPDAEARAELAALSEQTGLPATDVLRYGPAPLLDAIAAAPAAR
ncbi:MAG TPA: DUF1611 domain-containing protein [Trebonia sp.]|jgi:uncharacterized NAD-dependent epimerase/dehydratase family protein|nr:DUF1611 domain-containing protein [Trebonia sp.]